METNDARDPAANDASIQRQEGACLEMNPAVKPDDAMGASPGLDPEAPKPDDAIAADVTGDRPDDSSILAEEIEDMGDQIEDMAEDMAEDIEDMADAFTVLDWVGAGGFHLLDVDGDGNLDADDLLAIPGCLFGMASCLFGATVSCIPWFAVIGFAIAAAGVTLLMQGLYGVDAAIDKDHANADLDVILNQVHIICSLLLLLDLTVLIHGFMVSCYSGSNFIAVKCGEAGVCTCCFNNNNNIGTCCKGSKVGMCLVAALKSCVCCLCSCTGTVLSFVYGIVGFVLLWATVLGCVAAIVVAAFVFVIFISVKAGCNALNKADLGPLVGAAAAAELTSLFESSNLAEVAKSIAEQVGIVGLSGLDTTLVTWVAKAADDLVTGEVETFQDAILELCEPFEQSADMLARVIFGALLLLVAQVTLQIGHVNHFTVMHYEVSLVQTRVQGEEQRGRMAGKACKSIRVKSIRDTDDAQAKVHPA